MAVPYRAIKYSGKQFLFERFGIINYDDKDYQKDIEVIGKEITNFILTGCSQYYRGTQTLPDKFGDAFAGDYEYFIFQNFCNIDRLQIYIFNLDHINLQMIHRGMQPYEDDSILLSNEYAKENHFYVQNGCKTKVATICINYSSCNITEDNFNGIVEHELKHLFDQNTEYKNEAQLMNKDVMTSEKILQDIPDDVKQAYNNFSVFYNDIKYYTPGIIPLLLGDLLYYMNKSEISARLVQQKYNKVYFAKKLYKKFVDICNNIITKSSDTFKKKLNQYIIDYNFDDIYGIKFNNNYISNTNKLCKFYLKRLDHFIKNCDKILCAKKY